MVFKSKELKGRIMREMHRCGWAGKKNILMINYHDTEWGVPAHDDRYLFEKLILDNAQAGLSWETILNRREGYRKAFSNFDYEKIAKFTERKKAALMLDSGIIRNRLKIESAVKNARGYIEIIEEFGSFDKFLWDIVDGKTIKNKWKTMKDIPAQTEESEKLSKALKARGFTFVGPTICYAFMQAIGMVNDHLVSCFRYKEVANGSK